MLTEICAEIRNYFSSDEDRYIGSFKIQNGSITPPISMAENQYYRIIGSVFNDGVYKLGEEELVDESFIGAVWLMAVPKDFLNLVKDISDWQEKYGNVDSQAMSPYQSESFGGYSYSKSSGGSGDSSSIIPTWKSIFRDRLWRYKKI